MANGEKQVPVATGGWSRDRHVVAGVNNIASPSVSGCDDSWLGMMSL